MRKSHPSNELSKRTNDLGSSQSSRPFIKDFQWYKSSFASKHREIKDLLKRFGRMEEQCEQRSSQSSQDLENGSQQSVLARFNQLSDEI